MPANSFTLRQITVNFIAIKDCTEAIYPRQTQTKRQTQLLGPHNFHNPQFQLHNYFIREIIEIKGGNCTFLKQK